MISAHLEVSLRAYVAALEEAMPGEVEAVYGVGALALDDFSPRQSNVDLVVVTTDPLGSAAEAPEQSRQLAGAERRLWRAGRPPAIWYTTWEEVAADPRSEPASGILTETGDGWVEDAPRFCDDPGGVSGRSGTRPGRGSRGADPPMDTPMTRALLRDDAIAVAGPDWPVVWFDEPALQEWCRVRLHAVASSDKGLVVLRRVVSPMVLEAARLAFGALTGKVVSKSAAGEAVRPVLPAHFRRILTDCVGYRQGAHTSMYWGPYERKYDALRLLVQLEEAVAAA